MTNHNYTLRTPLKRVRGLGASGNAVGHWWTTRLTSLALVPLTLWFVVELISSADTTVTSLPDDCPGPSCIQTRPYLTWYETLRLEIASPSNAFLLILFTILMFHHAASGMQAVFEDYVHKEGRKLAAIYGVKAVCLVLGGACVFSILRIAFSAHS